MANITILYDIASDTGTLTGAGSNPAAWVENSTLSVQNLRTDDLAAVSRYLDIESGHARMVASFDRVRPVSMWALIGHNASTLAEMQPGLAESETLTPALYLPERQPVWEPTVVWGSLPWGAFPWDGVDKSTFPGAPIAFHLASETMYAEHAWLDIFDPSNEDGFLDAGRLMIGQGWTPPDEENHDYGSSIRPVHTAQVTRTRGGRRLVSDGLIYREWEIKLSFQSEATAIGVYHDLMMRLGKRGDMLIIWDSDKIPAIRNRMSLYCALADTSPITITDDDAWEVVLKVEELT